MAKEKFGIAFLGDLTGALRVLERSEAGRYSGCDRVSQQKYGGIGGREVYLEWADTKSKIDIATSGYERLQVKGFPVWHTCGTGEQQILKARYEQDRSQVIYTCSTSPDVIYPPGYCFGTAAYYPDRVGSFRGLGGRELGFQENGPKAPICHPDLRERLRESLPYRRVLRVCQEKGVRASWRPSSFPLSRWMR